MDDTELVDTHARAAEVFSSLVAGVRPGDWARPTPCSDWTVRELVNHVVAGNHWAAELATGATIEDVGSRLDGDVLGEDAVGAARTSAAAAIAAFGRDGAMDEPCAVSYGPVPGSVYCGHRIIDLVGHSWDLATATAQDAAIDPQLASACIDIMVPQFDMLAGSGAFGDASDPGPDTDPEQRLLRMMGR